MLISMGGCVPPESLNAHYNLTNEEVAYMIGCVEMGQRAHVVEAATKCSDMSYDFLQRHKRPGQ